MIDFIVDLQFGSTGKGLFAGYMAQKVGYDTVVTAWGPNAGHTFIDHNGNKMIHTMLANGVVSPGLKRVMIGPGSVINAESLVREIKQARAFGYLDKVCIFIHPHAAIVLEEDREEEKKYGYRIGSTMKGTGEAVCRKIKRDVDTLPPVVKFAATDRYRDRPDIVSLMSHTYICRTPQEWNNELDKGQLVLVEGSQGFSLGVNSGFYPYCTSRECSVQQLLVDCALPMSYMQDAIIYGVARTYPIRVANRFQNGTQIGWSGPCYDDQEELEWHKLGLQPELTTVTKLPRRIFSFSEKQIAEACRMNRVTSVFLNFANYVNDIDELASIVESIERHAPVSHLGYGPLATNIQLR